MRRLVAPGGWYGFALPGGAHGVLVPNSHIQTFAGRVVLPGENVLFLVGALHRNMIVMAGQGHQSGAAYFFDGDEWQRVGPTHGVSPCAFGAGVLFVVISPTHVREITLDTGAVTDRPMAAGSQGLRYVDEDNEPVTGDATYRDGDLFEWTKRGSLRAGQGHTGGCVVGGRVLEPGDTRFVRFERRNDELALAIVTPGAWVGHYLTVAELSTFPLYMAEPDKPPPPPPPPRDTMKLPAAVKAIRARFVQAFPIPRTPGGGEAHEQRAREWSTHFAEQVDFEHQGEGYGMKRADGGRPISKDTIAQQKDARLLIWDLLTGTGTGEPRLVDDPDSEDVTGQVFVAVTPTNHLQTHIDPVEDPPEDEPQDPPPPVTNAAEMFAAIQRIEQRLDRIFR